jgi:uncharacterized protein
VPFVFLRKSLCGCARGKIGTLDCTVLNKGALKLMKICCLWLTLSLCCLVTPGAFGLQDADWLYAVEVPVEAQTEEERDRAAAQGLLIVLSRLTGLSSVPRGPEIVAAMENPDAYYNRFAFVTREQTAAGPQRNLRVTFQPAAIQGLLGRAQLPVWWSKRPNVLVWLVLDNFGEREVLSSTSDHPLVAALQERARLRGLPLVLPLMDLDDNLAVSPADVWGKVGQSLDTAALRYDADLVLIGRISVNRDRVISGQPYRGDWEVWLGDQPLVDNFTNASAQSVAERAVDMLANRLAEQFAVLPRPLQVQRLSVTGLDSAAGYAEFMAYLERLEFVERVAVTGLSASAVNIAVASRAETAQLEMLLTQEGRLTRDKLRRGLDLQLIWRG